MKISAILPTRNRPSNLIKLFNSVLDTTEDLHNFEFSVRIDNDDVLSPPVLEDYKTKLNILITVGPRHQQHAIYWNDAWERSTGEVFMMCGDDVIFRTKNWDKRIRNIFAESKDNIIFVYGDDKDFGIKLGTLAFIHKNWTDALGHFVTDNLQVYALDTWNHDIANRLGRAVYVPDLVFEHMHFSVKKSEYDLVYQNNMKFMQSDNMIFDKSVQKRIRECDVLRKRMS